MKCAQIRLTKSVVEVWDVLEHHGKKTVIWNFIILTVLITHVHASYSCLTNLLGYYGDQPAPDRSGVTNSPFIVIS